MALLTIENLSVGYDSRPVAAGLDLVVREGDYLFIVGENGSGKTTLMRTILGLQEALAGTITFGGGLRKNEIGYLPQQTQVQKDFPATVREIVLSGCLSRLGLRPFYNKAEKQLAQDNMRRMGIESLADQCYRELSGGQQQRVLLARALCAAGRLLLLDEPVAGLDPKVTQEMYDLILDLNRSGTTIIMISHDMDAALRYASHILHIGGDVFFGTKEAYLKSPLAEKFISVRETPASVGGGQQISFSGGCQSPTERASGGSQPRSVEDGMQACRARRGKNAEAFLNQRGGNADA